MKKIILIYLFLLGFCFQVKSQKYYPLVDTNKIWSLQHVTVANPSTTFSYYIKFIKDTTIKGIVYKKVFQADDSLHLKWVKNGYIRETEDKKVYYLHLKNEKDTIEYCIYNFNIKKGDVLFGGIFKVDSIDSIKIGKQFRKRFYLIGRNEIWIEGIGSLCGILDVGMCTWIGGHNSLLCFYENDTLKYQNPEYDYCYYQESVNVNEFKVQSLKLNVKCYPNPTNSLFFVSYSLLEKSNVTLSFYDITGTEIERFIKRNKDIGEHKDSFNIENIKSGIFFYKLTAGSNYANGKIIVIRN